MCVCVCVCACVCCVCVRVHVCVCVCVCDVTNPIAQICDGKGVLEPHIAAGSTHKSSLTCVIEAMYGRELLSALRDNCIGNLQLQPVMRVARLCLKLNPGKRTSAHDLLGDNFFVT